MKYCYALTDISENLNGIGRVLHKYDSKKDAVVGACNLMPSEFNSSIARMAIDMYEHPDRVHVIMSASKLVYHLKIVREEI